MPANESSHKTNAPAPIPTSNLHLLNNTSIATDSDSMGNQHVFFQDSTGAVRHAIRLIQSNDWTIDEISPVPSGAKMHTPLTALIFTRSRVSEEEVSQICLQLKSSIIICN